MATEWRRILPFGGGSLLAAAALVVGCGNGADNSPSMGAVPPKPNPNMNAQLPESIRNQMAQAKPGADAEKMGNMKPHSGKS